jgi:hypothetical protein
MRSLARFALLAAGLALAGCSGSVGRIVDNQTIEKQAQKQFDKIAKEKGQKGFPPIKCPKDLEDPKVGDTTRCLARASDGSLGITVTVTAVDDSGVKLSFQADDHVSKK